jgi:RimJ/RimL family protein N-acetyltransferase
MILEKQIMVLGLPLSFETQRLDLRSYTPSDGSLIYKISRRNVEHWKRFESDNAIYNLPDLSSAEEIARLLVNDWASQRCFFIAAFEKPGGDWVGQIYVGPKSAALTEFEVGYVADLEHEGMGYISEALRAVLGILFTRTDTQHIWIHCSDENARSARVADRCGFSLMGHLQKDPLTSAGSLEYMLNRNDWEKQKGA